MRPSVPKISMVKKLSLNPPATSGSQNTPTTQSRTSTGEGLSCTLITDTEAPGATNPPNARGLSQKNQGIQVRAVFAPSAPPQGAGGEKQVPYVRKSDTELSGHTASKVLKFYLFSDYGSDYNDLALHGDDPVRK